MIKRFITLDCVIADDSAAAVRNFPVELPKDFDRVTGVAFLEKSAGGLTEYSIGLQERDGKETLDLVDRLALVVTGTNGMAMPPKDRFLNGLFFPIDKSNKKTVVTIETFAATTSELSLQVVFECEAD